MRSCVLRAAILEVVNRRGEVWGGDIVEELKKKGIDINTRKVGQFARSKMHRKDIVIVRVPLSSHSNYHNLYRSLHANP